MNRRHSEVPSPHLLARVATHLFIVCSYVGCSTQQAEPTGSTEGAAGTAGATEIAGQAALVEEEPAAAGSASAGAPSDDAVAGAAASVSAGAPAGDPTDEANAGQTAVSPEAMGGAPAEVVEDAGAAQDGEDVVDVTTPPPSAVTDLLVEDNPNNVLSAYVSWNTDVPATSEVQFGQGQYTWKIEDSEPVTAHRVLVIGMHAAQEYMLKARSSTEGGEAFAETTYTTAALPTYVPVGTIVADEPALVQPGWTLTNLQVGGGTQGLQSTTPPVVVMYDEGGEPVWYHLDGVNPDTRGDVSLDYLANGNILIGPSVADPPREVDLGGNVIWEGPAQEERGGDPYSHHVSKLENGNYLLLRDVEDPDGVGSARLEELTPDNELVWSWNLYDYVLPPAGERGDWCHANSATVDLERDEVYLNCRYVGLIKTSRTEPTYAWHLAGNFHDTTVGDVLITPAEAQFSDTHDPEIHPEDGTILFYDNGGASSGFGQMAVDLHSRVLEFAVDQESLEATLVWEFPGDFDVPAWFRDDWHTPFWGDADRLANGNVLVTAGVRGAGEITHIFEVKKDDGQVVWDLSFPEDHGSYRAERISPPPLVQPITE